MEKQNRLVLIDGNSLINRAFYALPPLSSVDGTPSNAVYGFATMLLKIIFDYRPKYIAVAFDMRAPTFRHEMYDGYKANRKGMPDDLAVQMPLLKGLLAAMNLRMLEKEGIEADDIIGTMAKCHRLETLIVTGDRDSLQLIDDTTTVLLTKRGITEIALMNEKSLLADFGLTPSQVIDYKALAGDQSDSIPGVSGIGDKTAVDLLQKYGTLGGVYRHIDEIKGKLAEKLTSDKEKAELSKVLATIKIDCEIDTALEKCEYAFPLSGSVMSEFAKLNFKSLMKRADIFGEDVAAPTSRVADIKTVTVSTAKELIDGLDGARAFSLTVGSEIVVSIDGTTQIAVSTQQTLFAPSPTPEEVLTALAPMLRNAKIAKYVYDAKQLMKLLDRLGITLAGYEDVALMQYLVDLRIKLSTAKTYAEDCGFKGTDCAAALVQRYATLAADLRVQDMQSLYADVELPLAGILKQMENDGFKLNLGLLERLSAEYLTKELESGAKITQLAGRQFNINSPKQLAQILFVELGIPYPQKTTKYSTSAEILSAIDGYGIIDEVLRYRFIAKLRSTYIEGLKRLVGGDGVVHTEFNQMLTTTGRLSSSEPNLQNIPVREEEGRALRGLFIARDGHVLVAADYSQIELRVMAHLSGDKNLIAAYKRGDDIHTAVAAELFGEAAADVTSQMRRVAKTVNFGIIYGMSAFGLSERLHISPVKAKDYIDKYFEKYPGVKNYLDRVVEEAKKTGAATSILGRRRNIPELRSSDYRTRQFGERAAMNMPMQASAADIIKLAMLNVSRALDGMKSRLILQVHDELIIDAPLAESDLAAQILKREMENAMQLSVPLVAEVKTGGSWLECK